MKNMLYWLMARLAEPSSWAGVAAMLSQAGVPWQAAAPHIAQVGIAVASLLAFCISEKSPKITITTVAGFRPGMSLSGKDG